MYSKSKYFFNSNVLQQPNLLIFDTLIVIYVKRVRMYTVCHSKKLHMWNSLAGWNFSFWDSFQAHHIVLRRKKKLWHPHIVVLYHNLQKAVFLLLFSNIQILKNSSFLMKNVNFLNFETHCFLINDKTISHRPTNRPNWIINSMF